MPLLALTTPCMLAFVGMIMGTVGVASRNSPLSSAVTPIAFDDPERPRKLDTAETIKQFDPADIIGQSRGTDYFVRVDLDGDGPDDAFVSWDGAPATTLAYVVRDVDSQPVVLLAIEGVSAPMGKPYALSPSIIQIGDTTLLAHTTGVASCLFSYRMIDVYEIGSQAAHLRATFSQPESSGGHQSTAARPQSVYAEIMPDGSDVVAAKFCISYSADPLSYCGLRKPDFEWRAGPRVDMPRALGRVEWVQRYRWDADRRRLKFDPDISDWKKEPIGFDYDGHAVGFVPTLEDLIELAFDEIEAVVTADDGYDRLWVLRTAEWLPEGETRERLMKLVEGVEDPWAPQD